MMQFLDLNIIIEAAGSHNDGYVHHFVTINFQNSFQTEMYFNF
jgi:hypothetical protein